MANSQRVASVMSAGRRNNVTARALNLDNMDPPVPVA